MQAPIDQVCWVPIDEIVEGEAAQAWDAADETVLLSLRGDGRYQLLAGGGRLLRCRMEGKTCVDAVICPSDQLDKRISSLLDKLVRGRLHYLEEAQAYRSLMYGDELDVKELTARTGRSSTTIRRKLRLLNLGEEVLAAVKEHGLSERFAELLLRVPLYPAKSFTEAVQSLWFGFAFLRLGGNWPGIGCIDRLLGPYLKRDLAEGKITMDEAREVLASMFIKGCEWIETDTARGSGDAQHYQNIVLGGTDENGCDVTNEVSYLCLEIVEELGISDFPISVRLNKQTPKEFLRLLARVMRHGGGVVAVYNEDTVYSALRAQGYPEADIHDFANDGCWEVQIPGKTYFSYMPMDFLHLLLQDVLHVAEGEFVDFSDMDALKAAYAERMKQHIEGTCEAVLSGTVPAWREGSDVFRLAFPTPMIDLFEHGCAESGRGYLEGGTPYVVISPHMGGVGDVANALCAIDHLCFIEKRMSVPALCEILRNDWNGQEQLALYAKHKLPHYGNGDAAADAYYAWAVDAFADACAKYAKSYPIAFPPGISTFGRQIEWMAHRTAVPHGYRRGEILAGNTSPTPGTDTAGATATVRSYCASDLSRMTTGAALDIKLYPGTLEGENGLCALEGLMQGFCALGGYFMQVDVLDVQTLLDAREHPEQYKTLSVRVSGWNARFVTLDDAWQRMVLERAGYLPEEQA